MRRAWVLFSPPHGCLELVGVWNSLRTGQGKRIDYDGESGKITNVSAANQYLQREPRKRWVI